MGPEDMDAFHDFVTARTGSLLRTAFLLTGDRGHAEDAVQSVFARVFQSWWRLRDRDAAESYCRRALVREVMSWRRKRQVVQVLTADLPERGRGTDSGIELGNDDLRRALLSLPPRQRAVVVLRFYVDLTEREVANVLEISVGSVKQHAHRGLAALRVELGDTSTPTMENDR